MTGAGTVASTTNLAGQYRQLSDIVARPGTRAVMLAGSRDPNAAVTVILLDDVGPAFVVKVPTTTRAAEVIANEAAMLATLAETGLGPLAATLPRAVGHLSVGGMPALVSTALPGVPMTVGYHAWRHTARRRRVRADFRAASDWLADLQTRTAGPRANVAFLGDSLDAITKRFPDPVGLSRLRERLAPAVARLAHETTPRTVVHGDYWFGNLLLRGGRVAGVVDWASGETIGEPLRDVARFAISYALYLDRHVRPGHRVPGHRGLRAGAWGSGIVYAATGRSWFGDLVRRYLTESLTRLGVPGRLWPEVLIAGIAEVAASADHPEFARDHLNLLVYLAELVEMDANRADVAA